MTTPAYTTDTSDEAARIQLDGLRRMTPQRRIAKTCEMSQRVRKMAFDAIRRRHPDDSSSEIRLKFLELTYGKQLADDVRHWQREMASE